MVALATDDASVGLDLDLQDFAVLSAGKHAQLQTTLRTLWRVKLEVLAALGQLGLHRPAMACAAGLLPPGCSLHRWLSSPFADASAVLGLAPKHALLEVANLRVGCLQLGDQHRFALGAVFLELIEKASVASFPTGITRDPSIKLRSPVRDVHDQLDVFLLGQSHRSRCDGRRTNCSVDIGSEQALQRRHAPDGSDKRQMCPAIPEASLRTGSPNVYPFSMFRYQTAV